MFSLPGFLSPFRKKGRVSSVVQDASPTSLNESASHKQQGNAFLNQGKLAEASACYRQAIASTPDDADAHINLGFILTEQKRYDEAESYLKRALEINPKLVDAFYMLGTIAREQGNLNDAIDNFNKALEIKPDFEIVYRDLCHVLFQAGQNESAKQIIIKGIALNPELADFHYFLGNLYISEKNPDLAINCFLKALSIQPDYAEVHSNLGAALQTQGRLDEALESFRKALSFKPDSADAHYTLAISLHGQGRLEEAIDHYRHAIVLKPDFVEAHLNLGGVFQAQGKLDAAIECCRHTLLLAPEFAKAHLSLGSVLHDQNNLDAASACYQKAISLMPDDADAYINLGSALQGQGKLEAAIKSFRQAILLKPDFTLAGSNLLYALSFHDQCSAAQYLAEAKAYGSNVASYATPYTSWTTAEKSGTRALRVGLVSGDFKEHPVGFFLESILAHLDRERIALVAYTTTPQEDALTARIKPHFAMWKSIVGLNDEAAARKIHDDGIHILIDLSGHTANNRLPVFAWRPAPVQASWLGYWASTGVAEIDYLLADPLSVPDSHQPYITETVWHLRDTRLCFTPPAFGAALPLTPLPAMRNGYITFGSFQNTTKITDAALVLWARILDALPHARLRLQSKQMTQATARDQLRQRLMRAGIAPERVKMEGMVPREQYLAAHAEVDIILDTFPFPGGTTTCESLWMGVPTITLAGVTLLGRQGASIMNCAGLDDWIAHDEDDYVAKTLAHAADLDCLARLRAGLREQVLASALFDAPRFAQHMEDALQGMWEKRGMRDSVI